jgi:hypothetical protein
MLLRNSKAVLQVIGASILFVLMMFADIVFLLGPIVASEFNTKLNKYLANHLNDNIESIRQYYNNYIRSYSYHPSVVFILFIVISYGVIFFITGFLLYKFKRTNFLLSAMFLLLMFYFSSSLFKYFSAFNFVLIIFLLLAICSTCLFGFYYGGKFHSSLVSKRHISNADSSLCSE